MTGPVWNPMAQQYEPTPPSLADFLLQRIAEDEERVSQAIGTTPWAVNPPNLFHHIALRHLGDCEAKRRIIEHADTVSEMDLRIEGEWGSRGSVPWDEDEGVHLLRLLALPYVDHPDYDEAWKP